MRHLTHAARCERCSLHLDRCLCALIVEERPRIELLIVRHWKEALKPTGSAALLHRCLPSTTLLDYGARDAVFDDALLQQPGCVLLMPPDPMPSAPLPLPEAARLVLVDGTWSQARRLVHRLPALARMPRWCISKPARLTDRLRQPHEPWARSTFEAAAEALGALEDPALELRLLSIYDEWVQRTWLMRGRSPEPA